MSKILVFFFVLAPFSLIFSQSSDERNPFEYKWMNKNLPIDTLISYGGDTLKLSDHPKCYVINFWFTNCSPCIAELKWLNKLKQEYTSEELEFLAVSFEKKEVLDRFLQSHQFNFDQYCLKEQQINENFLTIGYPTTIMLDKSGKVIFQKSGGSANQEEAVEIYQLVSKEIKKLGLRGAKSH